MSEKQEAAIAYFEDAIRESDEIIAECSPELQDELEEQKGHFAVALECMCRPAPEANEPLTLDELREMDGDVVKVKRIPALYTGDVKVDTYDRSVSLPNMLVRLFF